MRRPLRQRLDLDAAHFVADGIIDDDCATPLLDRHRVRRAGRDDHRLASANAPGFLAERLHLSLEDVPTSSLG